MESKQLGQALSVKTNESNNIRDRLTREMIDLTNEYVNLYSDETNLDGYFSAEKLRIIADKMDELKEAESKALLGNQSLVS